MAPGFFKHGRRDTSLSMNLDKTAETQWLLFVSVITDSRILRCGIISDWYWQLRFFKRLLYFKFQHKDWNSGMLIKEGILTWSWWWIEAIKSATFHLTMPRFSISPLFSMSGLQYCHNHYPFWLRNDSSLLKMCRVGMIWVTMPRCNT